MAPCTNVSISISSGMFARISRILIKRKFSGCYHTFGSQTVPETISLIIGIICLCADMAFDLRTDFSCISKNTRVCNDQRIWFQLFQFCKVFPHPWKVLDYVPEYSLSHTPLHHAHEQRQFLLPYPRGKNFWLLHGVQRLRHRYILHLRQKQQRSLSTSRLLAGTSSSIFLIIFSLYCFTLTETPSPSGMIRRQ